MDTFRGVWCFRIFLGTLLFTLCMGQHGYPLSSLNLLSCVLVLLLFEACTIIMIKILSAGLC